MENNNNNNKMNIVTKTLTTLPEEVCNIIYEYYKLPFLDEIQNPFNKYCLVKSYWRLKMSGRLSNARRGNLSIKAYLCSPDEFIFYQTKRFNNDKYHLPFDNKRRSILPQYVVYPECSGYDGWYSLKWYNLKHKSYREQLIHLCYINGIEFKDRTPTKCLMKKLMKI